MAFPIRDLIALGLARLADEADALQQNHFRIIKRLSHKIPLCLVTCFPLSLPFEHDLSWRALLEPLFLSNNKTSPTASDNCVLALLLRNRL